MRYLLFLLAEYLLFALGIIVTYLAGALAWDALEGGTGPLAAVGGILLLLIISYHSFRGLDKVEARRRWGPGYARDGTPLTDSPRETYALHPRSLLPWFKGWVRGLSDRSSLGFILFGTALVGMLLMHFTAPEPTQLKVYIYGKKEQVFIDGVPVTRLRKHDSGYPYAISFLLAEKRPDYEITVRDGEQVIHRARVSKGAYLINATTDSWVTVESVRYGPGNYIAMGAPRHYMIGPAGLGVYQLDDDPSIAAVNFGNEPAFSVGSRRTGRGAGPPSHPNIVKLNAGKMVNGELPILPQW